MDRRSFLRMLGFGTVAAAAAATSVLDLERMLWVPGERTIFIPPVGNTLPLDWVTREGLRILQNNLTLLAKVNREYSVEYLGVGEKIDIHLPRRFAL